MLSRAGIINVYQYGDETLDFDGGRLLDRVWRGLESNLHTCNANCLTNTKIAVSRFVAPHR
jgi:hypothetical protein